MSSGIERNLLIAARIVFWVFCSIGLISGPAEAPAAEKSQNAFVLDVVLNQPIEKVWNAITKKSLVDKYYFSPINADISTVGADIYYGTASRKLIIGTITALEVPRLLMHSFRFAEEADTTETTVTYALTADGMKTRLHLEHRGYAANSQGYADISLGWPIIIDGLKSVLDRSP